MLQIRKSCGLFFIFFSPHFISYMKVEQYSSGVSHYIDQNKLRVYYIPPKLEILYIEMRIKRFTFYSIEYTLLSASFEA